MLSSVKDILTLWFSPRVQSLWFDSTPDFDAELSEHFRDTYQAALAGELFGWEKNAEGALALTIVLDQFPLNMFRGKAESFAGEAAARIVAGRAIGLGFDQALGAEQKLFLYLPYMHSEVLADQDRSVELFRTAGLTQNLRYAEHHRDIVRRFGRFPHRNAILGRTSTPAELAYLDSDEAFLG